ncbi:MAG: PEP-CTERM sorting domain-containing protein [Planctomycetota bacterium]
MNVRILLAKGLLVGAALLAAPRQVPGQTFTMDTVFPGDGHPDAVAELTYSLENGSTEVEINVSNAAPEQYYSIWLKLDGVSPLTGIEVAPFAGASDIASLAPSTPDDKLTPVAKALGLVGDDGSGAIGGPNGFFTDANGSAAHSLTLDFPVVEGGYFPFDDFDPSLSPVPLGSTPFLLNTLSHTDQVGHGLFPDGGPDTAIPWFWTSHHAVPEPSSIFLVGIVCVSAAVRRRWKSPKSSR